MKRVVLAVSSLTMSVIAIIAIVGLLQAAGTACAQTPPPDANTRALQSVNNELMQAWTGTRAALMSSQDQTAQALTEVARLKEQLSKAETEKFKPLPTPPPEHAP